jgi:hypothetical protein
MAQLGAVLARVTTDPMHIRITAPQQVAIAGGLITVAGRLIAIRRALITIRRRLIVIRSRLIRIS